MSDTYRVRSDETWAQARDDYLAGLDAALVCERHDVGLSAFRKRAKAEGWRKADQPDPEPAFVAFDPDAPPPPPAAMADLVWRRMAWAVKHDRPLDAVRWLKLHQDLTKAASDSPPRAQHGEVAQSAGGADREAVGTGATPPPDRSATGPLPLSGYLPISDGEKTAASTIHTFHPELALIPPDPGLVARVRNDLARARRKRRPADEAAALARLRRLGAAEHEDVRPAICSP